jgi:2-succinyl-6-hydroxy-2,4-cyclohexadiene-1-carboxylate synthase
MVYKGLDRKLYFLHGFAGDPSDWDGVIQCLPEYDCIALAYPFELPARGVLIGYSMGGRIALSSPIPKLILSGHPGLLNEDEKKARHAKEELWIRKLKTISILEFFEEWYAQPLFASLKRHSSFPAVFERRLKNSPETLINQMEKHSLIHQPTLHRNAIFIHGEYDTAYKELYNRAQITSHEIPKAGHACHLENPEGTARQIKILIESFL